MKVMISSRTLSGMVTSGPGKPSLSSTETERIIGVLRELFEGKYQRNKTALANAIGRAQPAVTQLLAGTNKPSLETARRIAKLAGVQVTDYLDETAPTNQESGEFPSKERAARGARILGQPEWAVEQMLTEPVPSGVVADPGVMFFYRRIEQLVSAVPQPPVEVPKLPAASARPLIGGGKRRSSRPSS